MKQKETTTKIALQVIGLSIVLFAIVTVPYYLNFHNSNISSNTQDWGAFGSMIAGIVGVINVSVFIILTIYISKLSSESTERQISVQKKNLITEFRQRELNNIDNKLDKAVIFNGYEQKGEIINVYSQVSIHLTNFQNQQKFLFPILTEKLLKNRVDVLLENYDVISSLVDKYHEKGMMMPKDKETLEQALSMIITLKSEFIEELQKFIIAEIEK
ncbi:hypothetical protein [Marinifilum sp.]|uniref:hypothetical protein n=1 Tax=Marinifilum sp. TaxID=2033137 RepID=UPI003BABC96A